jgi:hypothetical protein
MTRSFVVPSGKHKGRALDALEDAELQGIWSGWNGSPTLKKTEFFRVIVSEIEARTGKSYSSRTTVVETGHRSMSDEINRRGGSVPSSGVAVSKPVAKPKKSKRHRTLDDSSTHYRWEDRSGFVHSIPQDVLMTGREDELCPFDVVLQSV